MDISLKALSTLLTLQVVFMCCGIIAAFYTVAREVAAVVHAAVQSLMLSCNSKQMISCAVEYFYERLYSTFTLLIDICHI